MTSKIGLFSSTTPFAQQPTPTKASSTQQDLEVQSHQTAQDSLDGQKRMRIHFGLTDAIRAKSLSDSLPTLNPVLVSEQLLTSFTQPLKPILQILRDLKESLLSIDITKESEAQKNLISLATIEKNIVSFESDPDYVKEINNSDSRWKAIRFELKDISLSIEMLRLQAPGLSPKAIVETVKKIESGMESMFNVDQMSLNELEKIKKNVLSLQAVIEGMPSDLKQQLSSFTSLFSNLQMKVDSIASQERLNNLHTFMGNLYDYIRGKGLNLNTLIAASNRVVWDNSSLDLVVNPVETLFSESEKQKWVDFVRGIERGIPGPTPIPPNPQLASAIRKGLDLNENNTLDPIVPTASPTQDLVQMSAQSISNLKTSQDRKASLLTLNENLKVLRKGISKIDVNQDELSTFDQVQKNMVELYKLASKPDEASSDFLYSSVVRHKTLGILVTLSMAKLQIPNQKPDTVSAEIQNLQSYIDKISQQLDQYSFEEIQNLQHQLSTISMIIDTSHSASGFQDLKLKVSGLQTLLMKAELEQLQDAEYAFVGALKDCIDGANNIETLVATAAGIYWGDGFIDTVISSVNFLISEDTFEQLVLFYFAVKNCSGGSISLPFQKDLEVFLNEKIEYFKPQFLRSVQILKDLNGDPVMNVYRGFALENLDVVTENNSDPQAVRHFTSSLRSAITSRKHLDALKEKMGDRLVTDKDVYQKHGLHIVLPHLLSGLDTQNYLFPIPVAIYTSSTKNDDLTILTNSWNHFVENLHTQLPAGKQTAFSIQESPFIFYTVKGLSLSDYEEYGESCWLSWTYPPLSSDLVQTGMTLQQFITFFAFLSCNQPFSFTLSDPHQVISGGMAFPNMVNMTSIDEAEKQFTQLKEMLAKSSSEGPSSCCLS